MINPSRIHRGHAVIHSIGTVESKVRLVKGGHVITAWTSDLPKNARVGEPVNIQANFSITMDAYCCRTVNRPRGVPGWFVEYVVNQAYQNGMRCEYSEFQGCFVINGTPVSIQNALNRVGGAA